MKHYPEKTMTQSMKKNKLRKQGRTLLWTYLVPLVIVSLLLSCSGFRAMMGWSFHTSTMMARDPLPGYALFIGPVIIFLASVIAVFLFLKKRDRWVDWAIGIGIALTLFFVTVAALQMVRGSSFGQLGYALLLLGVNMVFLTFFIRYKANVAVARDVVQEDCAASPDESVLHR